MTVRQNMLLASMIAGAAVVWFVPHLAQAITIKHENYEYWHQQHGAEQTSVGQLSIFETEVDEDSGQVIVLNPRLGTCSGSVIGDQYFLTAGHCTWDAGWMEIEVGGQRYVAEEWYVPDFYNGSALGTSDISIIKIQGTFDSSIPRLRYNGMNGSTPVDPTDQEVEIVGYGTFGDGTTGAVFPAGTRRSAFNRLDVPEIPVFSTLGFSPLHYDFDMDPGSNLFEFDEDFDWETHGQLVLESSAAPGDSGGPVLLNGTDLILGVTSFGYGFAPSLSLFTTIGGNTNVTDWDDWIDDILAGTPTGVAIGTPGVPLAGTDEAEEEAELAAQQYLNDLANYYGVPVTAFGDPGTGLFWGRAGEDSQPQPGESFFISPGDLDQDGDVDDTDLGILLSNWEENLIPWQEGNLNFDTIIDDFDLGLMLANWTGEITEDTIAQIVAVTGGTVPEPTTLALLGLAGLALIRRRPTHR